ncbi:RHS repeat-associated core domain-containing protein, partial [Candidatus Spyradosoma sp. SGI.093]|uniref:RHS repeat-associated core domain-containing protein n=1 Tax=Candidatus Spyradosoma sp. SGI.093 TaxID=3420583 RepID=UPI003D0159B4
SEEPTATRPLAINVLGDNLYFPTVDLTKNVCELVDFYGDVAATYDYAPFGAVTAGTPSASAVPANQFQFSSEFYDSELGLVYYNYRHYSPALGRFLSRDPIEEQGGRNLYAISENEPIYVPAR